MLSRPVACCPAAQRQIRAPQDSIWITEDVLSRTFQRFCLNKKLSRRNESSVPGPMESRRRLGKRRIGNLSEAIRPTAQDFGALWGISGAADRYRWQWEAPSPVKEATPQLPARFKHHEPTILEGLQEISETEAAIPPKRKDLSWSIEDDLRKFRESVKGVSTDEIQTLCDSFNQSFKQSLALGLVTEDALSESLRHVTKYIREITTDNVLVASRCLAFYFATWEGLGACKVLRPADLGGNILNRLLFLLAQLPSTQAVKTLATDIVHTASPRQVVDMEQGVLSLVRAWLSSWINLGSVTTQAKTSVVISGGLDPPMVAIPLFDQSVGALANSLGRLPPYLARSIVYASTDYLVSTLLANFVGRTRMLRTLRYSWVSVVANMPCADEDLLVEVWSKMDFSGRSRNNSGGYTPNIPRLTLHEGCRLLLDFWISHGQIKAPERVRATFNSSVRGSNRSNDAGYLLQAVNQHKELCWTKTRFLTRVLRRLQKPHAIYHTLRVLQDRNVKLPASLLALEIKEMSGIDPRCALNIYKLYPTLRHDNTPLLLDGCSELVIAMINSPDFDPADIWGALGIPLYDPRNMNLSSKPLRNARVALVNKMALAFAKATCRSHRVALRNVMQCVMYLRRHGVSLSPDLTRAISYAGITRDLLSEHWVGTEKVLWILDLIKQMEGDEVAGKVDRAVYRWRSEYINASQRLRRHANPLRFGPID